MVIDSLKNKSTDQGFGCINRKIMANGTDFAEVQVSYSANFEDMLFYRQRLVENYSEPANRCRKKNIDVIDLHRQRERKMVEKLFRCVEH